MAVAAPSRPSPPGARRRGLGTNRAQRFSALPFPERLGNFILGKTCSLLMISMLNQRLQRMGVGARPGPSLAPPVAESAVPGGQVGARADAPVALGETGRPSKAGRERSSRLTVRTSRRAFVTCALPPRGPLPREQVCQLPAPPRKAALNLH